MEQKKLISLSGSKGRRQHGLFLAEGVRLLEEAIRLKKKPMAIYFDQALSKRGLNLLTKFQAQHVKTIEISQKKLGKICDTENSQGIVALFEIPKHRLAEIEKGNCGNILWCDSVSDPGNLGTLLRSALAFGFETVVLTGNCADPYSPKVVRSSMGGVFGITVISTKRKELLSLVDNNKFSLIASGSKGTTDISDIVRKSGDSPMILAIGSESNGLPEEIIDTASLVLRIRHDKAVDSLNVAVAGSILMRELYEYGK